MSGEAYTVMAFLVGALLTPVTQGIAYKVRRGHEQEDRRRTERKEALILLQETLLNLLRAEAAFGATDAGDPQRSEVVSTIAAARREVRLRAARVGDEQLWKLVNTPPRKQTRIVIDGGAEWGPGYPGVEPDWYDEWNTRIYELFRTL